MVRADRGTNVIDEETFLAAIAAEPDDDATRLAFADWLEEHDRVRFGNAIRRGVRKPKRFTFGEGKDAVISYTGTRSDLNELVSAKVATGVTGLRWTTYKGLILSAECAFDRWAKESDSILASRPLPEVILTTRILGEIRHKHLRLLGRDRFHAVAPWSETGPLQTLRLLRAEWPRVGR